MTYFEIRDLAWRILLKNQISELPVKVTKIAKNHGCYVRSYEKAKPFLVELGLWEQTNKTDAFTLWYENRHLIFYNQKNPETRVRFSIAHELGHILIGHKFQAVRNGQITLINREPDKLDSPEEKEANMFASRLLAPACVLNALNAYTPETISYLCNISLQSATFRAERMKKLNDRQQYFTSPLEKQVFQLFKEFIQNHDDIYQIGLFIKATAKFPHIPDTAYRFRCPLCGNDAVVSWLSNGHIRADCPFCDIHLRE